MTNAALLIPLIAVVLPILGLVTVLGFILVLRYLRMKETAMLLERGVTPEEVATLDRRGKRSRSSLFAGIITTMVGLALSAGLYPIGFMVGYPYPLGLGPWMIPGLLPLFVGLGLILWHYLNRTPPDKPTGEL